MKIKLRRLCAVLMPVFLSIGLVGCGSSGAEEEAARAAYEAELREYNRQCAELEELRARVEETENSVDEYIAAVNATVNGESFALVDGSLEYTAQAVLPDGMLVDHWLLDGESFPGGESFSFSAEGGCVVEAVLRPEKKLTAINAKMSLMDENGKPVGESFTELSLEDRDSVSVLVYAETDDLTTVDHWIVNGVAIDVYGFVLEFRAYDLSETTTFEPVFAACYTQHEAADPTPRYQQVPLSYLTEEGQP